MGLNSTLSSALLSAYGFANRKGLLANPLGRRLFVRSYFAYKRFMEDAFASLARKHPELFRGGHIVDVGANIGYTAAIFADAISPGFKVFAFEPEKRNFQDLTQAVKRHRSSERVLAVCSAVGEREGTVRFWENESHNGDHRVATDALHTSVPAVKRTTEVPVVSVDGFLRTHANEQPVTFVKVDVQGYELAVCKGMTETIERNPGVTVAVEYSPASIRELGFEPADLLDFLKAHGFGLELLQQDGTLVPLDQSDLQSQVAARGYVDLVARRQSRA